MDEAVICDRIALISEGKFLRIETPQNIINGFGKKLFAVTGDNMSRLLNEVREMDIVGSAFAFGDEHHVTLINPLHDNKDIEAGLLEKGCTHVQVKEIKAGIEDCYMALSQ